MERSAAHIALARMGPVDAGVLQHLRAGLESAFGLPVRVMPDELLLAGWDPARRQHLGEALIASLRGRLPERAARILGITEADLYAPEMNFIFGQAEVGGAVGVVSLHRLHPEFYGEPPNAPLFLRRALVECIHELGHTFGLAHCPTPSCVMSFSDGIEQADAKGPGFCPTHAAQLRMALTLN